MKELYIINKIFWHIVFLSNLLYIFSTEAILYFICRDFNSSIDCITQRLASLNILYVKLFQAIALNNCFIDDQVNNKLLAFTDNAPWSYNDILFEDLIEVCDSYNIRLDDGYETPTNSGMISLVFKGRNRETHDKIIIKIKRNNIDAKLVEAIEHLRAFLYILSFIPAIQQFQIAEIVNKNIDIITKQTDFCEEVKNMSLMRENCANLKYVQIPEVYEDVTKKYPNVIMMSYLEGQKINEIKKEDYEGFAKTILKFALVTSAVHGITHGDLHSGNILFIKDEFSKYKYKIGVLDFGIVYSFNAEYKNLLFDTLTQIFNKPHRESATQLLQMGYVDPPHFWEKIPEKQFEEMVDITSKIIEESTDKTNNVQIYKLIFKVKEYLNRPEIVNIGVRPSDDFIKLQLVLAMGQGVTYMLSKNNFMVLADEVINELFPRDLLM